MSLKNLPDHSRIWIFTYNHSITDDIKNKLDIALGEFVSDWMAHGKDLSAGYELFGDALLVIAVDETVEMPSGCSIDKAFRLLQEFGQTYKVDFFQRTQILIPSFDQFEVLTAEQATIDFKYHKILESTMVANTMLATLGEYRKNPMIPFGKSWLGQKILSQVQY